jgi:predicted AAA+ superfamily ATPase
MDEVQKIGGMVRTVKRLWDEDSANKLPLDVLLLGSSSLLIQKGKRPFGPCLFYSYSKNPIKLY